MIYFIADLHLSPRTPGAMALLESFLKTIAQPGNRLFILGDFFEVWVGDDDLAAPFNQQVAGYLSRATEAGLEISIQHGNRDFLLGQDFARATGTRLIPDPYVLSTPEWQFVLSHGDALCTDDGDYQAFRTQVRNPEWQAMFLAHPLAERQATARKMREHSLQQQADKGYSDLAPGETEDFLRQFGYATFIHGHTHQPATHDHIVDGIHVERHVLADWHEDLAEALCWDGEHLKRIQLEGTRHG